MPPLPTIPEDRAVDSTGVGHLLRPNTPFPEAEGGARAIISSRTSRTNSTLDEPGGEPNPETPADKRRRLSTTSQSSDGQSVSQRVAEVEDRETQRLQRIAEKELQRLDRLDRLRARREGSTSSASIDQPLLRVPMPTETSTDYTPTEPGEENLFCLETVREPEISLMVKPINPKNSEFDMKNATLEEIDGFKVSDNLECKTITEGRQGDCRGRGQQSSTTIS